MQIKVQVKLLTSLLVDCIILNISLQCWWQVVNQLLFVFYISLSDFINLTLESDEALSSTIYSKNNQL